jgi:large subunit ribosomal protein L3
MTRGILGKKVGMMQIFKQDGQAIPVTIIEAGPCSVTQIKVPEIDGYRAVQLGFEDRKESRSKKPLVDHFKKAKVKPKRFIREIKVSEGDDYKLTQEIKVDMFKEGDFVDVTGLSIGKGFQGGIKRWGWSGGDKSHGSMTHRRPGSIGASAFPSRVLKGHHLPGRMGGEKKSVQNLQVIKVNLENNLIMVKGAVPGHKNSYLIVRNAQKKQSVK